MSRSLRFVVLMTALVIGAGWAPARAATASSRCAMYVTAAHPDSKCSLVTASGKFDVLTSGYVTYEWIITWPGLGGRCTTSPPRSALGVFLTSCSAKPGATVQLELLALKNTVFATLVASSVPKL